MYQVIRLAHALGYVENALQHYRNKLTHEIADFLDQHGEMSDQITSALRSHLQALEDLESYREGEIRTLERFYPLHDFQSCALDQARRLLLGCMFETER